ncbi:hypothetical protein COLO4_15518 [Corchorus olitorius]|uniref:ZF-HD dimerization-type domain-containing protein n=1 Tax=Corchorus olitorius TaxID=93759 RepID=A0A1R3JMW8_9ROSI|nr:hypothetical protein COLO4_15518 [Corchorus olitorius]
MANNQRKPFELIERETRTVTIYKDCMRNHASHLGLNIVDGCFEFAPKRNGHADDEFNCEACGCHRSFHRQEVMEKQVPLESSDDEDEQGLGEVEDLDEEVKKPKN